MRTFLHDRDTASYASSDSSLIGVLDNLAERRPSTLARQALAEMGLHIEDLGRKSIAGVMADGGRTVTEASRAFH